MNPNIEVINPHLLGVKFSWVNAGFIDDFPLLNGKVTNPYATLTNDGVIVLNKDSELYNASKTMLNVNIMKYSDEHLQKTIANIETKRDTEQWDKYAESLLFLCRLEEKRRTLKPSKTVPKCLDRLIKRFTNRGNMNNGGYCYYITVG